MCVSPREKLEWGGGKAGASVPQGSEPGGQEVDDDAMWDLRACEQGPMEHGVESTPMVPDQRGKLHASAHSGILAQLGHQAVALPDVRLAREVLA